jgi:hypothetical protein
MVPHRVFCELLVMFWTAGGAIIGWYVGANMAWPASDLVCAFIGMACLGAFADICVGRK